jgi:hypothetical protein
MTNIALNCFDIGEKAAKEETKIEQPAVIDSTR